MSRVVAIGVFDGVHRGHRALLREAGHAASDRGLPLTVTTFDPHPLAVLAPQRLPLLLTTLPRREQLLRDAGAGEVEVLPFTAELAAQSPEEFVAAVLRGRLDVEHVVVGANFRFGNKAAGDLDTLRRLGISTQGVDLLATGDERVSSSAIRALVAAGDVAGAAQALDRPHLVEGPVVRGDQRGRQLGYPTANVEVDPAIAVPADGVYAGHLTRAGGQRLPAAISIGTNPTFDGQRRQVEAYVLDRDDLDLYDEHVVVEFVAHLRGQVRFDGVADLVEQVGHDVDRARGLVGGA